MPTIAKRLKTLRDERGFTKRQLVSHIPINYSTYANYESGFREPNAEVLQILSQYFDVSIDYLLGFSESRKKADNGATLTDNEYAYIDMYRRLDSHGRDMVDTVMKKELERLDCLADTFIDRGCRT